MNKNYVIIATGMLIILSRCAITDVRSNPVDIAISGVEEQYLDGEIQISGTLEVLDNYEKPILIEDVRIRFIAKDSSTIKTESLGTINDTSFSKGFSLQLDQRPRKIVIGYGQIQTEADPDFHGLIRNETGDWVHFDQEE